jgi:PAS domain S-box-containing protein
MNIDQAQYTRRLVFNCILACLCTPLKFMNNHPLRILYAGSAEGIEKIQSVIQKFFISPDSQYVNEHKELRRIFDEFKPEVIVASYADCALSTAELFAYLLKENILVPVILVLPEAFEELGVALLDRGAADYLTLENLGRLPYAIKNLVSKYRLELQDDQKYGYLFDQNLAGLYTTSVNGKMLVCNTAFATMLGYNSPQELIGKDVTRLYLVGSDRAAFLTDLKKHRKLNNYESVLVRKDGSPCYFLENIHLTTDGQTGEEICQGLMIDVTQLVLTKQNITRARTMLTEAQNLAKMGNWNYNMRKKELTVSLGLKAIFGISADTNFSVEEFIALIDKDDVERVIEHIRTLQFTGGKIENTFSVVRMNQIKINVKAVHTLDFDEEGKVLRYYGVIQDITALELAEKDKARITEELIKRNKALEQFTYVISHNLRAPVANIRALTEILKETDAFHSEQDLIDKMGLSVLNLDTIITDLNQILQIKQQQNSLKEQVNLHALMSSISLSIKNLIVQENVSIQLDMDKSLSITAVRGYLYSIFYNLTLNSIKYRRKEASPMIRIRCSFEKDEIVIGFQDNGKGIDLEKNGEALFGLYKRFDRTIEGKGLGLFMVKTQVEELGGSIDVQSVLGAGTLFIIRLPNGKD